MTDGWTGGPIGTGEGAQGVRTFSADKWLFQFCSLSFLRYSAQRKKKSASWNKLHWDTIWFIPFSAQSAVSSKCLVHFQEWLTLLLCTITLTLSLCTITLFTFQRKHPTGLMCYVK